MTWAPFLDTPLFDGPCLFSGIPIKVAWVMRLPAVVKHARPTQCVPPNEAARGSGDEVGAAFHIPWARIMLGRIGIAYG